MGPACTICIARYIAQTPATQLCSWLPALKAKPSMTSLKFRTLAWELTGVCESVHLHHPDFRVAGKIFATLAYPDEEWGMVKLTPDQQKTFMETAPSVFLPCRGIWGQRGATNVHLKSAKVGLVRAALKSAWENASSPGRRSKASSRISTLHRPGGWPH
jgi:hypothetical protein